MRRSQTPRTPGKHQNAVPASGTAFAVQAPWTPAKLPTSCGLLALARVILADRGVAAVDRWKLTKGLGDFSNLNQRIQTYSRSGARPYF